MGKWANPINIRFEVATDKELRERAKKMGLSVGIYIKTIVHKELRLEA